MNMWARKIIAGIFSASGNKIYRSLPQPLFWNIFLPKFPLPKHQHKFHFEKRAFVQDCPGEGEKVIPWHDKKQDMTAQQENTCSTFSFSSLGGILCLDIKPLTTKVFSTIIFYGKGERKRDIKIGVKTTGTPENWLPTERDFNFVRIVLNHSGTRPGQQWTYYSKLVCYQKLGDCFTSVGRPA